MLHCTSRFSSKARINDPYEGWVSVVTPDRTPAVTPLEEATEALLTDTAILNRSCCNAGTAVTCGNVQVEAMGAEDVLEEQLGTS